MWTRNCASKTVCSKNVRNVDKMYIHIYTLTFHNNENHMFWYSTTELNNELFDDLYKVLVILKQLKICNCFSCEIVEIDNILAFKDKLILLDVEYECECDVLLKNNNTIKMNCCKIKDMNNFNTSYIILFDDTSIYSTYGDNENNKCLLDLTDMRLIYFKIFNKNIIIPRMDFNHLEYKYIKSNIDNSILYKWYCNMNEKNYDEMVQKFLKIQFINENIDKTDTNVNINKSDDVNQIEIKYSPNSIIDSSEWIHLFCKLYLEEDTTCDIIFSQIYQDYCIASKWTNTPTVSLHEFIKKLRGLNKYTIKRCSKGMVIVGHKSLVSKQKDLSYTYNNNLSVWLTKGQLSEYIKEFEKYNNLVGNINHKYGKEVFCLLNNYAYKFTENLNYQIIDQFCSIPEISGEIIKFSEWMNLKLKSENDSFPIFEPNVTCNIYFPFSKKLLNKTVNDKLYNKTVNDKLMANLKEMRLSQRNGVHHSPVARDLYTTSLDGNTLDNSESNIFSKKYDENYSNIDSKNVIINSRLAPFC